MISLHCTILIFPFDQTSYSKEQRPKRAIILFDVKLIDLGTQDSIIVPVENILLLNMYPKRVKVVKYLSTYMGVPSDNVALYLTTADGLNHKCDEESMFTWINFEI